MESESTDFILLGWLYTIKFLGASIARAFTRRAFLCLKFLQKEMFAVFAQETC